MSANPDRSVGGLDLATLARVTAQAEDCIALLDRDLRLCFANDRLLRELQQWTADPVGRSFDDCGLPKPLCERWRVVLEAARDQGATQNLDYLTPRGGRTLHCQVVPVIDEGRVVALFTIARDLIDVAHTSPHAEKQAFEDPLTGLLNRRGFEARLKELIGSAADGGPSHALCYVDLDHFKQVNDSCGHAAGDELLRQLPAVIRPTVRGADVIARLGGDEFGVLLENCDLEDASRVAEKIRDAICAFRFVWDYQTFEVGASIGVVGVEANTASLDAVMQAADAACYTAKDAGRNHVHVSYPHDLAVIRRRGELRWVERVRQAIEQDDLVLHFQSIADLRPGAGAAPSRHEVLVRMLDQGGKPILPGSFIPAAERYQLVGRLDAWVVRNALARIADLRGQGLIGDETCFSINVSRGSLVDADLPAVLQTALEKFRVPPPCLCIEMRETVASANLGATLELLQDIKRLGCRIALDDFGSGVSSFSYLKNLPVDVIKIDGSLIRDILTSRVDESIVRGINEVAHHMGMVTVAKLVENEGLLTAVRGLGLDFAQGYVVARPRPLADFAGAVERASFVAAQQK